MSVGEGGGGWHRGGLRRPVPPLPGARASIGSSGAGLRSGGGDTVRFPLYFVEKPQSLVWLLVVLAGLDVRQQCAERAGRELQCSAIGVLRIPHEHRTLGARQFYAVTTVGSAARGLVPLQFSVHRSSANLWISLTDSEPERASALNCSNILRRMATFSVSVITSPFSWLST